MTTIENAVGKFGRPWQLDKAIQVEKLPAVVRECAARALNEPRFLANAENSNHAVGITNSIVAPASQAHSQPSHLSPPASTQLKTPILIVGLMCVIAVVICAWMASHRNAGALAVKGPLGEAATPKPIIHAAESMVPAAPALARVDERSQAAAMITLWAAAWSARDVERYLGFYAKDFVPPENISRDAWQEKRRDRILGKQHISVTISELGVEMLGENRAIARFAQTYEADKYREVAAPKTLILTREAGEWHIADEINLRVISPQKR